MSNMAYCRFQNTLQDLEDCAYHVNDDVGIEETRARDKLVQVCKQIIEEHEEKDPKP